MPITDAQFDARQRTARRVNHERWHDGPLEECDRCAASRSRQGGGGIV